MVHEMMNYQMGRPVPNFFLVGAARSGSTLLSSYLMQHPDVYIPAIKEPRYFARSAILRVPDSDPIKSYLLRSSIFEREEYLNLFSGAGRYAAVGDASVHYLFNFTEALPEILAMSGSSAKILMILREPSSRAVSHYAYNQISGLMQETLPASLGVEDARRAQNFDLTWLYRSVSTYSPQVQAYFEAFKSVKVVIYEDFIRDPVATMKEVFRFLQVNDEFEVKLQGRINPSGSPRIPFLNSLVFGQGQLKRWIGPVLYRIPESVRYRVRQSLLRANTKTHSPQEADEEIKNQLWLEFESERAQLSRLLGMSIPAWSR